MGSMTYGAAEQVAATPVGSVAEVSGDEAGEMELWSGK